MLIGANKPIQDFCGSLAAHSIHPFVAVQDLPTSTGVRVLLIDPGPIRSRAITGLGDDSVVLGGMAGIESAGT
jgi:hypothetical protein